MWRLELERRGTHSQGKVKDRDSVIRGVGRGSSVRQRRREKLGRAWGATIGAIVISMASGGTATAQEETHVFDPALSLRGSCITAALDPAPDPGCPYLPPPDGPQAFSRPHGVAIDSLGYTYVTNRGEVESGAKGRLDIFDPSGQFVTEVSFEDLLESLGASFAEADSTTFASPRIDTLGNLYLHIVRGATVTPPHSNDVLLYEPGAYPPVPGGTYAYVRTVDEDARGLGVDPANNHLYVNKGTSISEYESAQEGSGFVRGLGGGTLGFSTQVAIGPTGDIYANDLKPDAEPIPTPGKPFVSQIYVFDGGTGAVEKEIDGSDTPGGGFQAAFAQLGVVVEQDDGDVYVYDTVSEVVYQFQIEEGEYKYLSTIEHSFKDVGREAIAVSDCDSCSNKDYFFVTSHPTGTGHLFAFKPKPDIGPPLVSDEGFSGVTTNEALLEAKVDPKGATTRYRFEYVEEDTYFEDVETGGPGHGFDHATRTPDPDDSLDPGASTAVSTPLTDLVPGEIYRFRVVAENCSPEEPERECVSEGEEGRFATYPSVSSSSCPNEQFRTGSSAGLPDCRAHELVTPGNANGRSPRARGIGQGDGFDTTLASPDGGNLIFGTGGGSIPGIGGSGAPDGDFYEARRGGDGWTSVSVGPTGTQARAAKVGGFTADHQSFWNTAGSEYGSLLVEGKDSHYVRTHAGEYALVGVGSLGADPKAVGKLLTLGAAHVIFVTGVGLGVSAVQLEPDAPPSGIDAIYDRTSDGLTHVVSLLPGETTPAEDADYLGAAADGSAVAFKVGAAGKPDTRPLYLRADNAETLTVSEEPDSTYAGISSDGERVFYVRAQDPKTPSTGDIFAFEATTQEVIPIGSGGESTVVNISADGSYVYFVSPKQLDGAEGVIGEDNLYVWDGASVEFVATLDHIDVTGVPTGTGPIIGGLALWTPYIGVKSEIAGPVNNPSRTSSDGRFLVFESRAELTGSDTQGHAQVYRYDAEQKTLLCVSCNPTLAPASAPARLQSLVPAVVDAPSTAIAPVANVSEGGGAVFFESEEALVPGDLDGLQDVYEWQAQGVGACARATGCVHLISGGHSVSPSFLYAATPSGGDVFFRTRDTLLGADIDGSPSIYDARVGGGFPEAAVSHCLDSEACRGAASSPPGLPSASSADLSAAGKARRPRCPKGKRRVTRRGKAVCLKRHRRGNRPRRQHRRAVR